MIKMHIILHLNLSFGLHPLTSINISRIIVKELIFGKIIDAHVSIIARCSFTTSMFAHICMEHSFYFIWIDIAIPIIFEDILEAVRNSIKIGPILW